MNTFKYYDLTVTFYFITASNRYQPEPLVHYRSDVQPIF